MNTRQIITAAFVATSLIGAAGTAMAQEATPDTWLNVTGNQSRASVQAELLAARQNGALAVFNQGYVPQIQQPASRAVVVAETQRAIASGELAALNAEAYQALPGQFSTTMAGKPAVKAAR